MTICRITGQEFEISQMEQEYCEKRGIPLPTICPYERFRQMYAWRSETKLFQRKCSKTGDTIISSLRPDAAFPVYERDVYFSEEHDPLAYGRPYDFDKPFFQQFQELLQVVPHISLLGKNNENSPYTNFAIGVKDCHFIFSGVNDEYCLFGEKVYNSKDCIDCTFIDKCELCYECVDCKGCYNVQYSQHSFECRDSQFLYDCRGCKNCFGCVGLEYKEYHIWNKQVTKEEYEQFMENQALHSRSYSKGILHEFENFLEKSGHEYNSVKKSENCDGQYIESSADCHKSIFLRECENVRQCFNFMNAKDIFICSNGISPQSIYNSLATGFNAFECQFTSTYESGKYLQYSMHIWAPGEHLFGCAYLNRSSSYCILNKQYTKEEYMELVPRIITHMKSTGEYGQFFPMSFSDYPYNDTIAQEYMPLDSQEQRKSLGVRWQEEEAPSYTSVESAIPDSIEEVDETVSAKVFSDKETGKPFRIQKKELAFYKKLHIPLPDVDFYTRNQRRKEKMGVDLTLLN